MQKTNFCDRSHICIFVSGTIPINGAGTDDDAKQANKEIKQEYLKIVHHLEIASTK